MRNGLIEKVICMTEKRYKRLVSSIDYYYCIDTNDDKGLTEEDMLNRLNEQDKRIKELKKQNEELIQIIKGISKDSADAISKLWRKGMYD